MKTSSMRNQKIKNIQNILAWLIIAMLIPISIAALSKNLYRGIEFLLLAIVVCPKIPITPDWLRLILTAIGCGICRLF